MSLLTKGLIAALLAVAIFAGVQTWRVRRANAAQVETSLALSNEKAAHDTTRALAGRELAAVHKSYGDSLTAVTKRIEQHPQQRDAVSNALGTRSAGSLGIGVGGKTATGTAAASSTASVVHCDSCARVATFDVRAAPFTSHADVTIRSSGRDSITLRTTLDRATLTARLECGEPERGVRPASLVVVGPPWLASTVEGGQLEPRVCNPDLGKTTRHWHLGLTGGYGILAERDSARVWRIHSGPSVTVGVTWTPF